MLMREKLIYLGVLENENECLDRLPETGPCPLQESPRTSLTPARRRTLNAD